MDPDPLYELIGEAMQESPENRLGMAIEGAFSSLDEVMAIAADPKTRHLVEREIRLASMLETRANLIASFIRATMDQPGKIKMVVNNVA